MSRDERPERPDPLAQLERSHRRLEEACDALQRATTEHDLATVTDVARFFDRQGRRHEEDEEQSLFPRLLRDPSTPLRADLERLAGEHRQHEALHSKLDGLASASPPPWDELERVADQILRAYRDHIELEERAVFPAARASLTAEDVAAIQGEMMTRRGR